MREIKLLKNCKDNALKIITEQGSINIIANQHNDKGEPKTRIGIFSELKHKIIIVDNEHSEYFISLSIMPGTKGEKTDDKNKCKTTESKSCEFFGNCNGRDCLKISVCPLTDEEKLKCAEIAMRKTRGEKTDETE